MLPVSAQAQVLVPSPPAVNQDGMKDFCIYGNHIYSLGAELCVANSNTGLRCAASEGSKAGGQAFWSFDNKEWPGAPGWRCGTGG
jgi:hypothetical protein